MKKVNYNLIFNLALAAFACPYESVAQKKTWRPVIPIRPNERPVTGGVRDLTEGPTTDESVSEPTISRGGTCSMDFVNNAGYFIDIWFDEKYIGRISPW